MPVKITRKSTWDVEDFTHHNEQKEAYESAINKSIELQRPVTVTGASFEVDAVGIGENIGEQVGVNTGSSGYTTSGELLAFPGAEGLAANVQGARGYAGTPTVVKVTNLNNSGTGSLRDAIEGTGKDGRFITFDVSGTILLSTPIRIWSANITILGQTSPGGICVAGAPILVGDDTHLNAEEVIIMHMRLRCGVEALDAATLDLTLAESLTVWNSSRVMIAYCSLSWGSDEISSVTNYINGHTSSITYYRCIFSHGLHDGSLTYGGGEADHGYGPLIDWTWTGDSGDNSCDFIQCYFAMNDGRNPNASGYGHVGVYNCVMYNWRIWGAGLSGMTLNDFQYNFMGNWTKSGPNTLSADYCVPDGGIGHDIFHVSNGTQGCNGSETPFAAIFTEGNLGCTRLSVSDNEWLAAGCGWSGNELSTSWQALSRFAAPFGKEVTVNTMDATYAATVVSNAGATYPVTDSYDTSIKADFNAGTGSRYGVADVSYPGAYPTFSNPTPPTDSNSDGVPDSWVDPGGNAQYTIPVERYAFDLIGIL